MVDMYAIHPDDEPFYRRLIQKERALAQNDQQSDEIAKTVRCVMVVRPPLGFEPGICAVLRRDPYFPWCYEVSVNGYPGFGTLDKLRFRLTLPGGRSQEYEFLRNSTNREIRDLLPAADRGQMTVTGGEVSIGQEQVENPNWVNPATTQGSIPVHNPRYITQHVTVNVGRWFFGFRQRPEEFVFAETDEPPSTDPSIEYDDNGFSTIQDQRVTVRVREVPFLLAPVTRPCTTLVDTSVPSPIAAGSLAYAARVPGLSLSLMSVEPRVYQELSAAFELSVEEPEE